MNHFGSSINKGVNWANIAKQTDPMIEDLYKGKIRRWLILLINTLATAMLILGLVEFKKAIK